LGNGFIINVILFSYFILLFKPVISGRDVTPGARPLTDPMFRVHRLAEHTLPPSATRCRDPLAGPIAWLGLAGRQAPH